MSFDSNAWYSIQNFGNDFFLQCSTVGNCGTGNLGLSNSELYQIATANNGQSFYLRPKSLNTDSGGTTYCVNINTGTPAIAACNDVSASWGIADWNGNNAGDGKYFFSTQKSDSLRLFLGNNGSYTLLDYKGQTIGNLDLMRWGISSRSAINDRSYSTVPAGISSGSGTATTTTSSSSSSSSSSTSSSSSSGTGAPITSNPGSTATTQQGPSTLTQVITPTVTASQSTGAGGSRTSSSITPTVVNSADNMKIGTKAVLALALILPQLLAFGV